MGKVAKLVTITMSTRVIVDENASESDIIELASIRMSEKIQHEFNENLESIEDDTECPYNPEWDDEPEVFSV
jgi:hypothetical protein